MDAPRWSPKSAVRKDDQFTAAPDFIDAHESDHLPLWGRLEASWHGMSRTRRVVVTASIALLATWGGTSAAFALDALGDAGSPEPGNGLAAQDDGGPSLAAPPEVGRQVAGAVNSTTPAPSLPALP